jgi:hypothetical protein
MISLTRVRHIAGTAASAAAIFIVGTCQATDFPITYSDVARSTIGAKMRASHGPISTNQTVDGRKARLIGDGSTDNTAAFRALFSRPGQRIEIPAGDYLTGSFVIPDDTILVLLHGVTIQDNGHLGPEERFIRITGSRVRIEGDHSIVRANRADYTTGEQRHGVFIFGATNVTIQGVESTSHGGDGFYVGGPPGHPATNVSIVDCLGTNNRRQGLSVTNARHLDVLNSEFSGTNGTPPAFGIDVEPNSPADVLDGIWLVRVRTSSNHGGGISLYLGQLNATSAPVDIMISDHSSSNETPPLQSKGSLAVRGIARYIRAH